MPRLGELDSPLHKHIFLQKASIETSYKSLLALVGETQIDREVAIG
jgi:hypothetical protein